MADKVQSIIEEIKTLSLLEASQLVKGLEEAFGVSAAAATVAAAAGPAAGAAAAAPAEEKKRNLMSFLRPLVEIKSV